MARWKKPLAKMLSDSNPITDAYSDASHVLEALGFEVSPHGGGSHRRWRRSLPGGNVVIIGLVEKGRGSLKPYLIRDMLAQRRSSGLIPEEME